MYSSTPAHHTALLSWPRLPHLTGPTVERKPQVIASAPVRASQLGLSFNSHHPLVRHGDLRSQSRVGWADTFRSLRIAAEWPSGLRRSTLLPPPVRQKNSPAAALVTVVVGYSPVDVFPSLPLPFPSVAHSSSCASFVHLHLSDASAVSPPHCSSIVGEAAPALHRRPFNRPHLRVHPHRLVHSPLPPSTSRRHVVSRAAGSRASRLSEPAGGG